MSYDHTFDDYIKQLTLVRSSRYFPSAPSHVVVRPPPTPYECDYSFEVEYAARRAHEAYTRSKNEAVVAAAAAAAAPSTAPAPPPHRASPVDGRVSLPSTSHAVLQPVRGTPVLQPSRPTDTTSSLPSVSSTSSLASSAAGAAATVQQENFEDFEGGANIFDELQMKSIDDRSALNEIWGAVQVLPNSTVSFNAAAAAATSSSAPVPNPRSVAAATAAPTTTAVPTRSAPLPPYPVSAATTAQPPARPLAPKPAANGRTTPNGVVGGAVAAKTATSPPTLNDSRSALAAKLTAKGFRSHIVQLALATLAHEQLPYVEYYIKATSTLEKVKVPADRGLAFLVDCKLTEKQDIVNHANVVTQLSGMGFPMEKCMAAAREAKGDRVKALDICLAT